MCKRVYVSYRWKEPVEGIARNWLTPSIEAAGFRCVIDVKDCKYKSRIDKFEEEIGRADRVIMLLSDKFFYSDQCMYEAALVTKAGNLDARLFPVNIGDYQHNGEFYGDVLDYWEKEEQKAHRDLEIHTFGLEPFQDKYDRVKMIKEQIGKFWSHVTKENFMNFSTVSENNFKMITELFIGRIRVVNLKPVTSEDLR